MRLADWLARLEHLDPTRMALGLERVTAVLPRLELPAPPLTITVAGTNGKGTVTHMLAAALARMGQSVGLYTSPHLVKFNERIVVNGEPVSDEVLVDALARVEAARGSTALTYFEFATLAALAVFQQAGVTARVLEVGLGGRLDAVNAVEPDAAVLTNVALDHQRWLGDTLADIGREKAAIFRAGKPAVIGMPEPPAVVSEYAAAVGAERLAACVDYRWQRCGDAWQWQCGDTVRTGLPLLDQAQTQNASAALATLAALGLLEALSDTQLAEIVNGRPPGRLELRPGAPTLLLDVCHNEDAVGRLRDWLVHHGGDYGRVSIVFGAMRDKAVENMVALLAPHAERWFAVSAGGQRAWPAEALARAMAPVTGRPVLAAGTPWQGLRAALAQQGSADLVIAAGSFPVVGQIRARL